MLLDSAYPDLDGELRETVDNLVRRRGVPHTVDDGIEFSRQVFPTIHRQHRTLYTTAVADMVADHPDVLPAPARKYPLPYTTKAVLETAGLRPDPRHRRQILVEMYDPGVGDWAVRRLYPWQAPGNFDVQTRFVRAVVGRLSQQARFASRDVAVDTARLHQGRGFGYARELSGSENCAFCALLASAGAVYHTEDTAKAATHPNCDCRIRLVHRERPWRGQAEADELYQLWRQSEDEKDFGSRWRKQQKENGNAISP